LLAGLPSVESIALAGLDVSAAATLIDAAGVDLDPERAVRLTGGNPLFLHEVIREGPASPTIAEVIADRFHELDPDDLDVVDLAAAAGDQIDVALIASALDRSTADVLDSLERSESAGLVGPGAGPGRFAFVHDVFRSVRYASLTASRRLRMHSALAEALIRRAAGDSVSAELARHACLAGARFDPAVAADLALQAGNAAADATDYSEAVTHYRRALEVLDTTPGDHASLRVEVRIHLGASLVVLGDADGLTMLQDEAQRAARRGDPITLATALCAMTPLGGTTSSYRGDQLFRSLAETAIATLPASAETWRIKIRARLGTQLWFTREPGRGAEMVRSAARAARQLDDPVTLGQTLLSYRFCLETVDIDQRLACGHELIELGDRTGLGVFSLVGRQQLWWCYRELGDRDEMNRWFEAAAEWLHGPDVEQLSQAAAVALIDGDFERAERITAQIDHLWPAPIVGALYVKPLRLGIAICRGVQMPNLERLKRQHTGAEADYPPELVEPLLALHLARSGRILEAQQMLDQACRNGFPTMYAGRTGASPIAHWAETAAIVKDDAAGAMLAELLEPLAGRLVDCCIYLTDTIDRLRALIRLSSGNAAEACELASHAVAASRRRRAPIFLGRELVVLAAARQRLGASDAETAEALEEALAIGRRTGARIITQDAALFLSSPVGVSRRDDQLGLTPREREVLDHLAAGASNAQIANALGISAATVRKHLEHTYEKLGVSNRTAAAARMAAVRGAQATSGERG
jgi:ATP/maltotriose-dependent transcriptional regulator MalT